MAEVCDSGRKVGQPQETSDATNCSQMAQEYSTASTISFWQEDVFRVLQMSGVPLIIDVRKHLLGLWDPVSLDARHGEEKALVVTTSASGKAPKTGHQPLHDFLSRFTDSTLLKGEVIKLKVRAVFLDSDYHA